MLVYSNKLLSGREEVKFVNISSMGIYNPAISGTRVYAEKGTLVIDSNIRQSVIVYDVSGRQVVNEEVREGKTIFNLESGIYTVNCENRNCKIFIR